MTLREYLAIECVETFRHGRVSRRAALSIVTSLLGSAAAVQLLQGCSVTAANVSRRPHTPTVPVDDARVKAGPMQFQADGVTLAGYVARPAQARRSPGVLVCHANRGLTPHIEDVTRRLARAGFVALALDLLSREGGTHAHNGEAIWKLLGQAPVSRHVGDFLTARAWLSAQPFVREDRIGMMGFCLGGGLTWQVAVADPTLVAAVPFYGMSPALADVAKLRAEVLAIYAGDDEIVPVAKEAEPLEQAMKAAGKVFKKVVYPHVDHAFFDDSGDSFDAAAAQAAWVEALGWLDAKLNR